MSSKDRYNGLKFLHTKQVIDSAKQRIAEERSGKQYGLLCRFPSVNRAMLRYWRFKRIVMICGMSGSGKSYFLNMLRNDFLLQTNVNFGQANFYLGNPNAAIDLELVKGVYQIPRITDENGRVKILTEGFDVAGQYHPESGLVKTNGNDIIQQAINGHCEYTVVLIHFGYEMDAESELIRSASNIMGASYGYLMSSDFNGDLNKYNRLSDLEFSEVSSVLDAFAPRREYYIPTSGNVEQFKATC
ncbi:MAG: hypothetical protein HRT72_14085, partial [Flavobacteriales bacterium]|nr:hypothetical protein [Flavobacteriales bacterium]